MRAGVVGVLALVALAGCGSAGSAAPAALPGGSPEPAVGPAGATRLAVIGDFGTGGQRELEVAAAVRAYDAQAPLDALVTTGDNVYPDGDPADFDAAWTVPYGWTADSGVPVVAALGNHDVDGGNTEAVMGLLGMPGRWYEATVGRVQLVVLDANDVEDADQQRFLEERLASPRPPGTDYRVVVFHQPAYSCSSHGSTEEVLDAWVPLFAGGDVDLVLNGHDHVYERFGPLDGTTYVVTGAGGADLYELGDCPARTPEPVVAEAARHYVQVEATAAGLVVRAVTPAGDVLDTAEIAPRGR